MDLSTHACWEKYGDSESEISNENDKESNLTLACDMQIMKENMDQLIMENPIDKGLKKIRKKINLEKPNKRIRRLIQFKLEQYGLNQEVKEVQTHVIDDTSNRNQELPYVDIRLGRGSRCKKNPTSLLIDSGSQLNILKNKDIREIISRSQITPSLMVITTASGSTKTAVIGTARLTCHFKNEEGALLTEEVEFTIVRDDTPLSYGILGIPFLRRTSSTLKFEEGKTTLETQLQNYKGQVLEARIPCRGANEYEVICIVKEISNAIQENCLSFNHQR